MGEFASLLTRILQLIFAIIVLGLSVNAVRWQYYHHVPATNAYAAFVGAFGCFAALIGLTTFYIGDLSGFIVPLIDGLTTIFFLAGGIAFAVGLRGVDCNDGDYWKTWLNTLISGGCIFDRASNEYQCGFYHRSDIERRCRLAEADAVFLFLGFVVSALAAILIFQSRQRATRSAA